MQVRVMQIRRLWGKHKDLVTLIDHEDIDNIDKTIYRIDEMVSQKERSSLTDIAELRFLGIQDLADKRYLAWPISFNAEWNQYRSIPS